MAKSEDKTKNKINFPVIYRDGNGDVIDVVYARRVPASKGRELSQLLDQLLEIFCYYNGAIGSIVYEEPAAVEVMQRICKLIPVDGQAEPGIDFEKIENDLEQLCRIFFTQSMDEAGNMNTAGGLRPSLLSDLHHLDYETALVGKAMPKAQARKEQEMKASGAKSPVVETEMQTA